MSYERLPWKWLLIYVLSCSILPGIFFSAATHWSVELGLIAGAFGAVLGALGWMFMGVKIPYARNTWFDAYRNTMCLLGVVLGKGILWKRRAAAAEQLLGRALTYLDHTPLEGAMDVADDIRQHFIAVENKGDTKLLQLGMFGQEDTS